MTDYQPRVLSAEEIEMYLKGDRQEVDRLILFSLNRLASTLAPHAEREERVMVELDRLGGMEAIAARAEYVDAMIARSKAKTQMIDKVAQSSLAWALIAFLGFLAVAAWESAVQAVKAKLGGA